MAKRIYEPFVFVEGDVDFRDGVTFDSTVDIAGAATFGSTTRNVVDVTGNTTLTASQSGSLVVLNSSTGAAVTLPDPAVAGQWFDFVVQTDLSSGSYSITAANATELFGGGVWQIDGTGATGDFFAPDGSNDDAMSMNGTTQGGDIGTALRFVCVSSTLWHVSGTNVGSGTGATPFA